MTEDVTDVDMNGDNFKYHPINTVNQSASLSPIIVAVSVVAAILLLIIVAVLVIKCRELINQI
jgi:hypothetical protein